MKFTNSVRFLLLMVLILLNIILRVPSTPHGIGWDSFEIHALANSVSTFGYAKWWVHPLSIFGLYAYSYASAVPFILSGISQLMGIEMEWTIWLFCVIIGIFSAFTAYLVAGEIWDNDIFKFLVAFCYSVSLGILNFSTWTASTRGFFIVLLPLFIYSLLKCRSSVIRYSLLTIVFFMLLGATHNLIFFTIPILVSYFVTVVCYKLGKYVKSKSIKIPENFINIAIFAGFFIMFLMPFFTRTFMELEPRGYSGSRYEFFLTTFLTTYVRYIGVLIVFVVGGYIYVLLKRNKRFGEWFLLLTVVILAPLLYVTTYMQCFILIFAFLLISVSLTNIAKIQIKKKKYAASFIVILLLISISFTGYYQFLHSSNDPRPNKRYMEEATYVGGLWIKGNVDKNLFWNDHLVGARVFAISEVPTLTGFGAQDMAYDFTNITDIKITKNSPFSPEFYKHGPYMRTPHTPYTGYYVVKLNNKDFDSSWGKKLISRYGLSYVIENEDIGDNSFIRSIHREKNNLYNNGKIRIWDLEEGKY